MESDVGSRTSGMSTASIRRTRVIHTLIVSSFVLILLLDWLRELVPYWEFVLAGGFVMVWMLGIRYERLVVIATGLATREELEEAEKLGHTWIDWEGVLGR